MMRLVFGALLAVALVSSAVAQNAYVTPGGATAQAYEVLCLSLSGNAIPCNPSGLPAVINVSAATTAQLIAAPSATQYINIAAWDFVAGGTTTVTLVYGTGTACATGQGNVTGPYGLTAQSGQVKGGGFGYFAQLPLGNALCITNSAAIQVSGTVSYRVTN